MADLKISALTASTTPLAGTEVLPIVQSSTTKQVSVANLTAGRAVSALSYSSTTGANFATSSGNVGVGTASPVTLKSQQTFQTLGNAKLGATNGSGLLSLGDTASSNANAGVWRGAAGAYGSDGNYLCLGGYDGITFTTGNSDISTQTKQLTIDTSGNATLATGNLVVANGKGIDFSATPGTGTSELLADYEEGTWSPNQGSGLTVVGTFSSSGTYTKVGRMVFVTGQFNGSTSVAIPATDIICTNLPFTTAVRSLGALNTGSIVQPGTVTLFSGTSIYGSATSAASTIYFSISYSV